MVKKIARKMTGITQLAITALCSYILHTYDMHTALYGGGGGGVKSAVPIASEIREFCLG